MAKVLISALIPNDIAERLDKEKKNTGISKSKLVENALEAMFNPRPMLAPSSLKSPVSVIEPGNILDQCVRHPDDDVTGD